MNNTGYQIFKNQLDDYSWKIDPLLNQLLSAKTSVKVGGPARFLICVSNFDEICYLMKLIKKSNLPWVVIGKGTNLLVRDEGFPGVIIQLDGEFKNLELRGQSIICGAGISNSKLSRFARKLGLSGAEFLSGIPGSVGGAVYMNAGAYGFETKDIVQWIEFMDRNGKIHNLGSNRLRFSYRRTKFTNLSGIIMKVCLGLKASNTEIVKTMENKLLAKRKKSQPINKHTWGSVFINPPGHKVARLIESCNLKGKGIGCAKISTKHANFIENTGGATFKDLMATVELARNAVWKKYKIRLKMEGQIIPDS